ncbi:hypothetical protein IFM89_037626 [Coptis chinensis]|uniref:Uncharacterized protein n=1 Tax=Coptis chinensis TaxID=261450 RepID=A0A835IWV3_9MAGN|nr:hypothetical protein IFM89_037626 [Coptis chinensis]
MAFCLLVFLILTSIGRENVVAHGSFTSLTCNFPAIFNFGDSNSDTGGGSAAFCAVPPPNGETFFGKPSGRFCDGRLIIDFIVEHLGLPYLSAYLDAVGADFRNAYDVNFSTFVSCSENISAFKDNLPKPEDFSKALYTFDIGQNDLTYGFQHTTEDQVNASIPDMLDHFSTALQLLYKEGARAFWIHNTGPIGCLPYSVIYYPSKSGNVDQNGCVNPQNEVAQAFNHQLKERLTWLTTQLPHSVLTYVDLYSAKYALISDAKRQGFVNPLKFCCGSYYGHHVDCGKRVTINGTVYGNPCTNPSAHISWDGIHYSQAANKWIANNIISGSLSNPPVAINQSCYINENLV